MTRKLFDRRSFFARVLGGAVLAGSATNAIAGRLPANRAPAKARNGPKATDNDATDAPGAGRGPTTRRTDADKVDFENRGRTWVTDRDTTDVADHGRNKRSGFIGPDNDSQDTAAGCRPRTVTNRTDEDPTDRVGGGRTGATDADSCDYAQRGEGRKTGKPEPVNDRDSTDYPGKGRGTK